MAGGFSRKWWQRTDARQGAVIIAESPADGAADSFAALGVGPALAAALAANGFTRPTAIQAAAYAVVRGGGDAVLAGETGIGKTLAYLAPLLDRLIADPAARVLVLHPNRDLCLQMARVADGILRALPADPVVAAEGLRTWHLGDEDTDPDWRARLLVGTPSAAVREWPRISRVPVTAVVLDEADTLLGGSFKVAKRSQYPVEQLLGNLRAPPTVLEAKRTASGADGEDDGPRPWRADEATNGDGGEEETEGAGPRRHGGGGTRVQYVLCGATVPNSGERNVATMIQKRWPLATWVQTPDLHCSLQRVRHRFVAVTEGTRGSALLAAAGEDLRAAGLEPRTLVFANSLAAVGAAFHTLTEAGHAAAVFTKEVPAAEREAVSERFRSGALPFLVCSGLGARGMDFPNVGHPVIQYEFAGNAVDHLHRLGRTARAGTTGIATTLYTPTEEPLVAALEAAEGAGTSAESAFSRRRSFRQRYRRFGPTLAA